MKDFTNAPILDPDNYDPNDYTENQLIKFKEDNKLVDAIVTDVDYITGSMAIEFFHDDEPSGEEINL